MVSGTRALLKWVVVEVEGGAGQRPRRGRWPMLSHIWGVFSSFSFSFFSSSAPPLPPASRPISQPGGPYPSLEAQIPVLSPKSLETRIWALGLGFGPWGWDLGLKTGIWASRLGYGPPGWDMGPEAGGGGCGGGGEEEEGGGENSPYVWKHRSSTPLGPLPCSPLNFNHNLLKQGKGTTDHLTLLRLLSQSIKKWYTLFFL